MVRDHTVRAAQLTRRRLVVLLRQLTRAGRLLERPARDLEAFTPLGVTGRGLLGQSIQVLGIVLTRCREGTGQTRDPLVGELDSRAKAFVQGRQFAPRARRRKR